MYDPRNLESLKKVAPLRLSPYRDAPPIDGVCQSRVACRRLRPSLTEPRHARIELTKAGNDLRSVARDLLALDDDIASDFTARAEGFLWLAIELGLHTPGVAKRQDKLILPLPSAFFTGSE